MAQMHSMPIAILGMSFRLPGGAHDAASMWDMLASGRHGITQIPADRWPVEELQHPDRGEPGRSVTFRAGTLGDVYQFDPAFFGISPRETAWLDPQQRLLLVTAYEAIEQSGIRPSALAGTDCGVYVGISSLDYGQHALEDLASISPHLMTGNTLSIGSNRISYCFDLHGPSLSIDTACSSSLVAMHHACEAIRNGEIPCALAGGVGMLLHPYSFVGFSKASMLSAQGHCRPFDAAADGYVRGEGGGMFLLKPLDAALKDGNPILAVIMASGVNTDGARKTGLTIPSEIAQTELMQSVLAKSGLAAKDIDFVEAHGTGTPVGDPIEARSIGQVFGTGRKKPLPLTSIKGNVGHLEPASGVAGLAKAILCLQHGKIPPIPFDYTPNSNIDFAGLHLQCPATGVDLPRKTVLTAAVNSFGFGGVNAHLLLQGAPAKNIKKSAPAAQPPLFLSARSDKSLRALAGAYASRIQEAAPAELYDIAWNAAFGRDRMERRLAVPATDRDALVAALQAYSTGDRPDNIVTENAPAENSSIVFVYRAQLREWKYIFVPTVVSLAEVPETIGAFRVQRHRWAFGLVHNAMKHVREMFSVPMPMTTRMQALALMFSSLLLASFYALILLVLPAAFLTPDLGTFFNGCCTTFLVAALVWAWGNTARWTRSMPWLQQLATAYGYIVMYFPLSLYYAIATVQVLLRRDVSFHRTPKGCGRKRVTLPRMNTKIIGLELVTLAYTLVTLGVSLTHENYWVALYAFLACCGFAMTLFLTWCDSGKKAVPTHVLITGATGAIGRALALEYAAKGIMLTLQGRNAAILEELARQCRDKGASVATKELDLRDRQALHDWVDALCKDSVPDLVISNAGRNTNIGPAGEAEPLAAVEALVEVNLLANMVLVDAVLPYMRKRKSGQLAITSSLAAYYGLALTPTYCATKSALKTWGQALRGWLHREGIRVNVILPGYVSSPMCDAMPGPKPFLWQPEKAARVIRRGLERDWARISFPFPLNLGIWGLSLLPACLAMPIARVLGYER